MADIVKKKKSPFYFYLILTGIPVLFFVLLEFGLRIFGYGFNNLQWDVATEGKLMLNQEIAKRYFYDIRRIPFSNQDVFDENKKSNAFRVFVLGGSSAAGYPFSPLGSFSRYVRDRLELMYPSSIIEVVNLSMTATNSYTIRDLFPGVVEQKPDLILIYAGHNEYYGALGIGSMESLGTSREFVNLLLYLNKYKTVELLRNSIQWMFKLFSDTDDRPSGTMMSRMAQDQFIELGSETFEAGISQFEGNIRDVLDMAKKENIPVILSTLASNLKDQTPFVSVESKRYPTADKVYNQANEEFIKNNYLFADSLFRFAKDLDGLRFRAPEKLNRVIKSLSQDYNLPLVNLDSVFSIMSPNRIIGNNIMTDHLHPTREGQLILGKLFYEKMQQSYYLPKSERADISDPDQDSIVTANFHFTSLDSTIADFRIKLLKNDWPFVDMDNKKPNSGVLRLKTIIDTLAAEVLEDKISWEESHRKMAAYYLVNKDINSFLEEMDALISQYPVVVEYYDYVANILIQIKDYARAQKYLRSGYEIKPNAFKSKWLGTIDLYNNKLKSAEKYLNESLDFNNNDAQVWYNLAGIYVKRNNYEKALELINKALSLKPNYSEAVNLHSQLQNRILQKK